MHLLSVFLFIYLVTSFVACDCASSFDFVHYFFSFLSFTVASVSCIHFFLLDMP